MPPKRKRTKRANGDGSLYQRASDGYWVGSVVLPDGKRKPVYGKTRDEAEAKLQDTRKALRDGLPVKAGRDQTLAEYMEHWLTVTLPQRVAAGKFAESTLVSYDFNARRHILPELGSIRMRSLTPAHVRKWQLAKLQSTSGRVRKPAAGVPEQPGPRLSPTSVRYYHVILEACLSAAMVDEVVVRNVASLVEKPTKAPPRVVPLTEDEAQRLLARTLDHRWRVLWLLTLGLGLRRGEALAVRWSHLDLDAGTLRAGPLLQRIMSREVDPETGQRVGRLVTSSGKTDASQALVYLPRLLVDELRAWRTKQRKQRLAARVWADPDLVTTTSLGTPVEPRNVNREWHKLCDQAGVRRCRIQDVRHTTGSWMNAAGVDPKSIQAALRHARLSTTMEVYVHVMPDRNRVAADAMDVALRRVTGAGSG